MDNLAKLVNEPIPMISELSIDLVPPGHIRCFWLQLVTDGMGLPVRIPVMVARGMQPGDIVGLTAAVHGNELNGIPVIQRLFKD